jgi:hypothetical protein
MPSDSYLPFSQRENPKLIPPQLKLGEVSHQLRNRVDYEFAELMRESTNDIYFGRFYSNDIKKFFRDFQVMFLSESVHEISDYGKVYTKFRVGLSSGAYPRFFDLIEFMCRHETLGGRLRPAVMRVFAEERVAYRIAEDGLVVAVGTEAEADNFFRAIESADLHNAAAPKSHLLNSGSALAKGDWSGSIRESIHAVESVARGLTGKPSKLSDALDALEKRGEIHKSLKEACLKLYGYASNAEGIRHAMVFEGVPKVDEHDALFMLGACASFVSYLLARAGQINASDSSKD